jgi:hypothetical protein
MEIAFFAIYLVAEARGDITEITERPNPVNLHTGTACVKKCDDTLHKFDDRKTFRSS